MYPEGYAEPDLLITYLITLPLSLTPGVHTGLCFCKHLLYFLPALDIHCALYFASVYFFMKIAIRLK